MKTFICSFSFLRGGGVFLAGAFYIRSKIFLNKIAKIFPSRGAISRRGVIFLIPFKF